MVIYLILTIDAKFSIPSQVDSMLSEITTLAKSDAISKENIIFGPLTKSLGSYSSFHLLSYSFKQPSKPLCRRFIWHIDHVKTVPPFPCIFGKQYNNKTLVPAERNSPMCPCPFYGFVSTAWGWWIKAFLSAEIYCFLLPLLRNLIPQWGALVWLCS